jgi:hypothetical protein
MAIDYSKMRVSTGRHATSLAMLHGSLMANHVADRVLRIHGAIGFAAIFLGSGGVGSSGL